MSKPLKIGVCIYCGSKDKPLKTEHIIPYSWGKEGSEGDVLLEASCSDCEKITSAFEAYVVKELFGNIRKVIGLRSRRGPLTDKVEQLVRDSKGVETIIEVPVNELTDILFLPIFLAPGLCRSNSSLRDCEFEHIQTLNVGHQSKKSTYKENEVEAVRVLTKFKNKTFEKFLLKVAYCTAVKNFGYDAVKDSPVPKILIGEDDRYGAFLGCLDYSYLPKVTDKGTWMQYGSFSVPNGIISAVKLFAVIDASPEYHVVIISRI